MKKGKNKSCNKILRVLFCEIETFSNNALTVKCMNELSLEEKWF
jgi:hypothetical protein